MYRRYIAIFVVIATAILLGISAHGKKEESQASISTIIVPHHDLVAVQRSQLFDEIKDRVQGRRIILLSPNHYDIGTATLQTRSEDFSTKFGTIPVDDQLYGIAKAYGAFDSEATFDSEHGVKTILPDIARSFPGQAILPIIVKPDEYKGKLQTLLDKLHTSCPDCLLIVSADFSHYQPFQLSELHDRTTLRLLAERSESEIAEIAEVGEPQVLWGALHWAGINNTNHFVLQNRTNSTEITKDYYAEGTTHVYGWYQSGEKATGERQSSFTVGTTGSLASASSFSGLGDRALWGTDTVRIIGEIRGAESKYLHLSKNESENIQIFVKGMEDKPTEVGDCVVVLEDTGVTKDRWDEQARAWVDNGADFVIRQSDHYEAPEPVKRYNNRVIAYSLGWFADVQHTEASSLLLHGEFTGDKITFLPTLITSTNGKPIMQRTDEASKSVENIFLEFSDSIVNDKGGILFSLNK